MHRVKFVIVGLVLIFVISLVNGAVDQALSINPTSIVGFLINGVILLFGLFYGLKWAKAEPE